MRSILHPIAAALIGVATTTSLFAGDQLFDFETDPTGVPGFVLYGLNAPSAYQFFDGNPASGGYLQLTYAGPGQNAGILFPSVDLFTNSLGTVVDLPVKAFTITMDLRVGNGSRRPADGFSISFVRQTDPALERALRNPPVFSGWAGADNLADTANRGDIGNPESGVHDGLSVCFDTWAGNFLPANGTINAAGNDIEGVYIRLDDVTIDSNPFTSAAATWNGGCYIQTDVNPADPCQFTVLTNQNTMQTGPWSGPSANGTGNGAASDGSYNLLGWAPFLMEVNEARQVTVTFKGRVLLDHLQLTNFPTSQGRLLFASRTGNSWEHTHIDNVRVITTPAVQPVFQSVTGGTNSFTINILNIATAQVTNFPLVTIDGTNVTSQVVVSNYLDIMTHGTYLSAGRFPARSSHTVVTVYRDALGQQFTNTSNFVTPTYLDLPARAALSLAQVDTSKPGFKIRSWQSRRYQPNQLRWTEEQVIGLRGPNDSDQSGAVGGYYSFDWVAHFSNGGGGALFPGTVTPFTVFGIGNSVPPAPAVADNCTIEMFGYLYFPTNGIYTMNIGSDDGFRLSFADHPLDRMGAVANEFDGGRGLGEPGDRSFVNISQPGAYPFRMLMENGGGGADLQWFTGETPANYILINDTNNPAAVLAYADILPAASVGAYVKKANPVRDAQNVVFYQPIVVDLGNGSGLRTVNQGTIVMAVDGTNQVLSVSSPDASTTRIVSDMAGKSWTVGRHTNVLTFADNAGTNYNYSWPFTVINVASNTVIPIPLANMVPAASVNATLPGFRVKSYQSPHDSPNHLAWTELQLQGLKGPNVAAQSLTNGPGYFAFASANAGGEGDGLLDLINNGGGAGEWAYHVNVEGSAGSPGYFGIGDNTSWTTTGFNAYRFNVATTAADSSALDIGFWLVFPSAGTYILHVNSDDNAKMLATVGSPFNKLGIVLTESSGGRGVAGQGGGQVGGDYRAISIPAAGAYAFRLVWENGGGGAGLEFSAYVVQPDGGVAKVPVNAYADPTSLRAYQTLTSGDTLAPYVSYLNPPHAYLETAYWQPIVAELTDGPGLKTVNPASITLTVDGVVRSKTVSSPSAGVTRIVQDSVSWLPVVNIAHNAILTYSDNSGSSYTNTWTFTVMNLSPFVNNQPGVEINVPLSSMVPIASVDHNQPGFRVYPHQTGGADPGNVQQTEEQLLGLRGANIADMSGAVNGLYYVHNDFVDLADGYNHNPGFTGYDIDAANGRYRFNYPFSRFGFQPKGGGVNTNGTALYFAGYMEFPAAGKYAMTFNSDDGFKVIVPFGNPRAQIGTVLAWADAGRGNYTGTAAGPQGSDTHFVFNIPAAGAYPIRGLWFNGGGGINLEWSIYQYLPNGSVARTIVGDTNLPGAIKVYQDSSLSAPFITSMSPGLPYTLVGNGPQVMRIDRRQNMVINLQDGNTTLDISKVSFTVNGVAQPLVITQPSPGVTTVTRFGTNALPAGVFGPAEFTYVDSANNTNKVSWTILGSDYYGTVQGPYPPGSGDAARPGFLWRTFQVDGAGTTLMPTHIEVAEQALAGVWTNNQANLAGTVNGFFVRTGAGANGTNGLINFNQDAPTAVGNFSAPTYPDQRIPGIPGLGVAARNADSIVGEALAYVEFPTSGIYTMGVNSDDGFRVSRGWGAPNNMGALVVNSPSSIAGRKATVFPTLFNTATVSRQVTTAITGQIIQALGVGNGATDPTFACAITNGALLNGKIALIYRGTCGFAPKVQNAVDAGAVAVVIVQDRPVVNAAEGWFPTEMTVTPLMNIPAVMISRSDANAIVQALSNNTAVVNVTLQPLDGQLNPPANSPVLGQANWGKGSSDILFDVNVPAAGVYPLRLLWFEGGGGANVEWFHTPDGGPTRIILNDTNNPASLKAYYGVTVLPTVSLQISGGNATANYTGTLQMADDVTGPWVDVYGQPPLVMPISTAAKKFFRSR